MLLHVCGVSNIGRVRGENQDALLVNNMVERKELLLKLNEKGLFYSRYGLLCAIADGLGGHQGGAVASQVTLECLAEEMLRFNELNNFSQAVEHLRILILRIHNHLKELGAKNVELTGMGSTLIGVYLHQNYQLSFHLGDSRLYRYRAGSLMQLTSDHSSQAAFGLTKGSVEQFVKNGEITNCIGGGVANCKPEIQHLSFNEGDILLLCSDGLSDMLDLDIIEETCKNENDLMVVACRLVELANAAGGQDNISVLLIKKEGYFCG